MRRLAHTTVAASLLLATLHLASAATAPAPTPTAAQARLPRHALVIGNSQYPKGPLLNPKNDAQAVADRLRQAGFSVTLKLDSGRRELQESIRNYGDTLKADKGIGVFYYAGHGVQLNWRNFLLPVDAKIRSKADIQAEAVDLGLLLDGLTNARNALNLIILDACRNNPFGADFRTDDKGLSQLDAPPGTLLAYATTKGAIANFTGGLAGLVAKQGIRVNCVAPGPIWTPLIPSTFSAEKVERFGADVPMKRPGQPEEVAPSYVFLASDDASYMTGQVLHPNGGEMVNG